MSLIFYIATIGLPYYWPPYPTSPIQQTRLHLYWQGLIEHDRIERNEKKR